MADSKIHPSAVVDPAAKIGSGVEIGPYSVIGPDVEIGADCVAANHVTLAGPSVFGPDNRFFPYCSIGQRTQDLKYGGEPTHLEVGKGNVFREFVTVNRATSPGDKTVIGNHNHFLAYAHVAHDCIIGDHAIFSNNGTVAGHVEVGDYAILGGLSAVHQFCRVGAHAMTGGCAKIVQDIPPFMIVDGNPARVRGVNAVGLQRRGFSEEDIRVLKEAYKLLFRSEENLTPSLAKLKEEHANTGASSPVRQLIEFIETSERGVIQ